MYINTYNLVLLINSKEHKIEKVLNHFDTEINFFEVKSISIRAFQILCNIFTTSLLIYHFVD